MGLSPVKEFKDILNKSRFGPKTLGFMGFLGANQP